ncbi:MAG: ABC transporter permease [Phycisphaerae bacterium]|jgi:putative ABC transport system permease protein
MFFYLRLAWTALRSLDSHFLRSLLATLGVLIGVASVVACMSILEGFSNDIAKRFKSLGSNLLYVTPDVAFVEGRPVGSAQTLTLEDVRMLRREMAKDIDTIAPECVGSSLIKYYQNSFPGASVIATSNEYFTMHAFEAVLGEAITRSQSEDEGASVVCLGAKVADELFGGMDPVGQIVKVGERAFRVVGVMEKKGSLGFLDADEAVYIPIKAGLKRIFNRRWLNRVTIGVVDSSRMEQTQKQVTRLLRSAHRIRPGQPDDFRVYNQEESLQNFNQLMLIYKIVFYSIAGISLLVGGIGIMNIMLVSVTERTREIGVRMAVGARRGDILIQFLVEALIISLLGGGFGLLLGGMFADLLNKMIVGFFRTQVTPMVTITAVATATIVGVLSGLYPALKASRLDPVDALRYE